MEETKKQALHKLMTNEEILSLYNRITSLEHNRITSLEYRVKTLEEEIEKLFKINIQLTKRISRLESKRLIKGRIGRK